MKVEKNYLDFVPKKKRDWLCTENDMGSITIEMENRGFFKKITQVLLKKPKYSKIHLEPYGSCIWKLIDGKRTIYEIACMSDLRFGEEIHPLYERIAAYISTLEQHGLIQL